MDRLLLFRLDFCFPFLSLVLLTDENAVSVAEKYADIIMSTAIKIILGKLSVNVSICNNNSLINLMYIYLNTKRQARVV